MTRQSTNRGDGKKGRKKLPEATRTGSQENEPVTDDLIEEIDPADFFDPEEFGIRRNVNSARHG